ncbi:MAG: cytochrome c-type biogenesis protein CcmH [Tateyamaria sp.]|jgi:cytochrome c-type biogenesis protein CcmH|nr:cytochrome c-type biogenesis protein CcmH [Tateyamaria sp.]MDG1183820.1 cytochrome c-type biogenesis protein CcmH [Tateyamaria sp.]MDG1336618.1 cytochrome c-type biogenesis protein CcmH [Tateyamaria sp.]MDG2057995.1 cytochrome c-type biogenesis protein CcmH [Tateyamaria sp.]
MIRLATALWLVMSGMAMALDPSEMLADPALEARARGLDHAMRCVVCQSESVASSNATWAVEARRVIREQIASGKNNDEVMDFFVERYGEFVLMNPRTSGSNWLLWAAGPLMFLMALGGGVGYIRGRAQATQAKSDPLSAEEAKRLSEILDE